MQKERAMKCPLLPVFFVVSVGFLLLAACAPTPTPTVVLPSLTPIPTDTPSPTPTFTSTPTRTATPTSTPTSTPTAMPTPLPACGVDRFAEYQRLLCAPADVAGDVVQSEWLRWCLGAHGFGLDSSAAAELPVTSTSLAGMEGEAECAYSAIRVGDTSLPYVGGVLFVPVELGEASIEEWTPTPSPTPTITPTPRPTATPDPCAGATSRGARQKFTFEQIVPCLSTPEKIVAFMKNNLTWDGGYDVRVWGINTYASAQDVYKSGVDDCDGMAEFAACVLARHGYEAYSVGISINCSLGHNVAGYLSGGKKFSINNGLEIIGPFDTWEALAQWYIDHGYAEPNQRLWLFSTCLDRTYVGDDVYQIPRIELR